MIKNNDESESCDRLKEYIHGILKGGRILLPGKFREWAAWKRENSNHENRIGIVTATPGRDNNNLPYLLQMKIRLGKHMENYLAQWNGIGKDTCWNLCDIDL